MNIEELVKDFDLSPMFAAGVSSVVSGLMNEKDAAHFVDDMCKQAAHGRYIDYDEDDGEDTFWGRNKSWLIPTIVGSLAFWAGADAERHGRSDNSYPMNFIGTNLERLRNLFGFKDDAVTRQYTSTKYKPEVQPRGLPGDVGVEVTFPEDRNG